MHADRRLGSVCCLNTGGAGVQLWRVDLATGAEPPHAQDFLADGVGAP